MKTLTVSQMANIIQKIRVRTKVKNKNPVFAIVSDEKEGLFLKEIRAINNMVIESDGKPVTCIALILGNQTVLNTGIDYESSKGVNCVDNCRNKEQK